VNPILAKVRQFFAAEGDAPAPPYVPDLHPEFVSAWGSYSKSNQRVSAETAKSIATAYRCANIISDDIASMPFQMFMKVDRSILQVPTNGVTRNMAYLLEVSPNRWMTPFVWKKTIVQWLLFWGNAYIWQPRQTYRELFILPADRTHPVFDADGDLWYQTLFPSGKQELLPAVEVMHLMINSADGLTGRSVLSYSRDTMGRQLAALDTQGKIAGKGLSPSGILWMDSAKLNDEARKKVKESYEAAMAETGLAVFDKNVIKFEAVTMKPVDAQFLETINATDVQIANFFGVPLYKVNQGKQSYESNQQQDVDYLKSTLNPYLVQFEQAARLKWLPLEEQRLVYFKFIRDALLQTDAKTRAEIGEKRILTGVWTPNEAREKEDLSAYPGGDQHYIPANMAVIAPDGNLIPVSEEQQQ
jgi:HK97 family phage portal protein